MCKRRGEFTTRMDNRSSLLFISQRLPYPPNKGEKIASFNIIKHLRYRFDVHVVTFVDTPEDVGEIERFRPYCASLFVERITKPWAWVTAMLRWLAGSPLSFALFRSAGLAAAVREVISRHRPVAIVAYSSNIADYALACPDRRIIRVFHFSDVDSEKFEAYAARSMGLKRWLFALEAKRVRAAEARLAAVADAIGLVSDEEACLFRTVVGGCAARIVTIPNGVDAETFDPGKPWTRPGWGDGPAFVFTGAMDYQPNVDAVVWFADAVLPTLRNNHGDVQFAIVGSNPAPAVMALGKRPGVLVTGRVPEVQPYLAHAWAAVAPLRIARGIQNKVLEALAMGRPTIVSSAALAGITAAEDAPVIVADGAEAWIANCLRVLDDPSFAAAFAARARPFVISHFSWAAQLRSLDDLLPPAAGVVEAPDTSLPTPIKGGHGTRP
jgi:polysaccharide biosynthesis protein PslH